MTRFLALLILLATVSPVHATDTDHKNATSVSLRVSVAQETEQDRLHATASFEAKARDAVEAQQLVNDKIKRALALIKKADNVEHHTGHYSTYQHHRDKHWQARQSIHLDSKDAEALLTLVGQLQQQGFAINNLRYALSSEKRESLTNGLLPRAIEKAKARAEILMRALGKNSYRITHINHGAPVTHRPPVYARSEMLAMDASGSPSAAADSERVSLSLIVDVVLE